MRNVPEHDRNISPERRRELTSLADRLGFKPRELGLLEQALTHSSFVNESGGHIQDNERLEYLGDSVLGLIVNEYLFLRYPDYAEGELARIKSSVVSERALAGVGLEARLGEALLMGRGERASGGDARPSNLADALEAVIAAVYLDLGYEVAREFVLGLLTPRIDEALNHARDPKSVLQELTQKKSGRVPDYRVVSESGPEHAREFVCGVWIDGKEIARGKGASRRKAERAAAGIALKKMQG